MKHSAPCLLLVLWLAAGCAGPNRGTAPLFYPGPPAQPRLQFLGSFSKAEDIEESSAFRKFVVGNKRARSIVRAHGVAWYKQRLYVCDPGLPHVVVFDFAQKKMRLLDPRRPDVFKKCIDIAVAPDGWKYITDSVHRMVIRYDAQDRYKGGFGDPEKWKPVGIAATAKRLYVTDAANHQLVILDRKTGKELRRVGAQGGGDDQFYFPLSVQVGPKGGIFVSDSFNFRVKQLGPDGTFLRSFGGIGRKPGTFARPRGIALDREGRIYAVDAAFENVQIFDQEGKLLLFFGGPGAEPGALNLPASVEVSYAAVPAFRDRVAKGREIECVIFVTSQTGPHKVNVYGLLRQR